VNRYHTHSGSNLSSMQLVLAAINLLTRFEVPSFTLFRDIIGAPNLEVCHETMTTSI